MFVSVCVYMTLQDKKFEDQNLGVKKPTIPLLNYFFISFQYFFMPMIYTNIVICTYFAMMHFPTTADTFKV